MRMFQLVEMVRKAPPLEGAGAALPTLVVVNNGQTCKTCVCFLPGDRQRTREISSVAVAMDGGEHLLSDGSPTRSPLDYSIKKDKTINHRVQVRDGGLIVASCPGVFSSGTRPRRLKWQWSVSGGSDIVPEPSRRPTRARAVIAQVQPGVEAIRRKCWCSTRGGGTASLDTQLTAGGRTGGRRPDQGGTHR
ncbi:hypothetical protein EVAR_56019_1 [Eumeta japonica]|uniref:Uncharacterized protein n=1 Tax=Eumeta variegata TaxID=151549 RepID=A0A4C1YP24_EUMVA|nr:hypothetical protein EVAR_56019_1 [Eumeta japonica]